MTLGGSRKNSLEKKTSQNISYQVGKSVCGVCVCVQGRRENGPSFTSRLQRAVPGLGFLVLQLALQVLRRNLSRLHETCSEHQGWLPPKHSHAAPITRSFQGLSQRFPVQLKMRVCSCWLWGQQTFPSSGLQMFGKEDVGWVNFYFV